MNNSGKISLNLFIEESFKNTFDSTISHLYTWKVLPTEYPARNIGFSCIHPIFSKNHSDHNIDADFSFEEHKLIKEHGINVIRIKGTKSGEVKDAYLKLTYDLNGRAYLDENNQPFFLINATSTTLTTYVHYILSFPLPSSIKRFFYKTVVWQYDGQSAEPLPELLSDKNSFRSVRVEIKRKLDPGSSLGPLLIAIKLSPRRGTIFIARYLTYIINFIMIPLFLGLMSSAEGRKNLLNLVKAIRANIIKIL